MKFLNTKIFLRPSSISAPRSDVNRKRDGFTLFEILVVISIIVLISAALIPQLRAINKERVSRESARVVASMCAQASQRAVTDGVAGVILHRNPRFVDNGFQYAATSLSLLRAVPSYIGDQDSDRATSGGSSRVIIPLPLEQPALGLVQAGDSISFNGSSVEYRILDAIEDGTNLVLDLDLGRGGAYLPDPDIALLNAASLSPPGLPFVINRLPRLLKSSLTELPMGDLVDFRFSGPSANSPVFDPGPTGDVGIVFARDGAIDQVIMFEDDGSVTLAPQLLLDNLRLFVAESVAEDPNRDIPSLNPINSPSNLWVSVNRSSGTANVGYNVSPANFVSLGELDGLGTDEFNALIDEARGDSDVATAAQ